MRGEVRAGRPGRSPRGRRRSSTSCRGAGRPAPRAGSTGPPPAAAPLERRRVQVRGPRPRSSGSASQGFEARPARYGLPHREAAPARRSASASSGRRRRPDGGRTGRPAQPSTWRWRARAPSVSAARPAVRAGAAGQQPAAPRRPRRHRADARAGSASYAGTRAAPPCSSGARAARGMPKSGCPWRNSQRIPTPAAHTGERTADVWVTPRTLSGHRRASVWRTPHVIPWDEE